MTTQLRLCIQTQTPLVRFFRDAGPDAEGKPLSTFREGEDVVPSPGGVTRMVQALLGRLARAGRVRDAEWLSLASQGPQRVRLDERVALEHVRLDPDAQAAYATAKGALWNAIHEIHDPEAPDVPTADVRAGLDPLSAAMAKRAASLHAREGFDAFYTHDFQLLPLAARLPPHVPRLFRWHVPVTRLPPDLARMVVDQLNRYDAVIVSTRRYADTFRAMGVRVPVHAAYPYLDEGRRRVVTSDDLLRFEQQWGVGPDDAAFVLVARLDPMKSQDAAIRALARIKDDAPDAKLVLVGGGGFSGGRAGLGMPHAARWRAHLEELATSLGVRDRVVLTGNLSDHDVDVAYTRARAVLLPSVMEGFGLAAVEGWLYGRPVLVSRGAGVSELVEEGRNGFTFAPGDDDTLSKAMLLLARSPDLADAMGRAGRLAARACHLRRGTDAVWDVLRGVVEAKATRGARR